LISFQSGEVPVFFDLAYALVDVGLNLTQPIR